jgi:hypothetical protein
MSKIFDEYAFVYGGFLTEQEKIELGKFASQLLNAKTASNRTQVNEIIKNAAAEIDNYEDFEAVVGLFDWLEKEAAVNPGYKKMSPVLGNVLAAATAAFALAPAVASMSRHSKRQKAFSESFEQILKDYPNLKGDPNTPRYFKLITDFAPEVASNPLVAGNVMDTFRKMGPASITPTVINELLGLQGRINTNSTDVANTFSQPMSKAFEVGANRYQKLEELARKDRENDLKFKST